MDGFVIRELESEAMSKRQQFGLVQDLVTGKVPVSVDATEKETA